MAHGVWMRGVDGRRGGPSRSSRQGGEGGRGAKERGGGRMREAKKDLVGAGEVWGFLRCDFLGAERRRESKREEPEVEGL